MRLPRHMADFRPLLYCHNPTPATDDVALTIRQSANAHAKCQYVHHAACYLCILILFLEWGGRVIWEAADIPSLQDLLILLCFPKFDIDLDSPTPQFLHVDRLK